MTIWERTKAALTPLGVPMAGEEFLGDLPETFLVYKLVSGVPTQSADNIEKSRTCRMQVSIYCQAGLDSLPDVPGAMKAAGFTRGPDIPLGYSSISRHFCLAQEFTYLEES